MKLQGMDTGLLPGKGEILLQCVPRLPQGSWFGVNGALSAEGILLPLGFLLCRNLELPKIILVRTYFYFLINNSYVLFFLQNGKTHRCVHN